MWDSRPGPAARWQVVTAHLAGTLLAGTLCAFAVYVTLLSTAWDGMSSDEVAVTTFFVAAAVYGLFLVASHTTTASGLTRTLGGRIVWAVLVLVGGTAALVAEFTLLLAGFPDSFLVALLLGGLPYALVAAPLTLIRRGG
ncbi:hypothetical protein [Streptosporangium sp. NPDC051022]|uniref:hypothetical protein n=1 Tax=Streptosporangium sp. NPDC051022 TaxID=3155752 RepID=UPI0034257E35